MKDFTEEQVQDLTDRVFLIKEKLESGNLKIASHLIEGFKTSFEAIRLRPDGKVDPNTVDGQIRAMGLAVIGMKQREEAKSAISLSQIQLNYFEFLFAQFGHIYKQMLEAKANPAQASRVMAKNTEFCEHFFKVFPELAEIIENFWSSVGTSATYHLQDGMQLKAAFAGDLFPAHWENAISTAGLYVDTIVLPCPFARIAPLAKILSPNELVSLAIKHILTAMSYRDFAIADIDPPLVLIAPNPKDLSENNRIVLAKESEYMSCRHAEYLFGRNFESLEHLQNFCDGLETVDQVIAELKGKDRLIFDSEWANNPKAQLEQVMKNPALQALHNDKAGHQVLGACLGRMPQAVAAYENARRVGGTPMICAETSWLYYTWMLEYQGAPVNEDSDLRQSMHVTRALTSESGKNLEWLGNVPPETVLEIRKQGLADEVRSILGSGINNLIGINPNNYFRTADQVVENLDSAFREHQKALIEAKQKKLKLYGIDIPACLAVGGVAVAAALTSNPALGAVSGLLGVVGLPNFKDIKTRFSKIAEEDKLRKTSPTGLLFRHVRN